MATTAEIEEALAALRDGDCDAVILEAADVYVQAAKGGGENLLIEAISDEFLKGRLTPDQLRKLIDLKFQPPRKQVSPNHWQHVAGDAAAVAELLAETLVSVYGKALTGAEITRV